MDPRALKFWSQLAEFGPDLGSDAFARAEPVSDAGRPRDAGPREWIVDFEEPRLSPGQTGFLAHMIGQAIAGSHSAPAPQAYVRRSLRAGIAFDRKA